MAFIIKATEANAKDKNNLFLLLHVAKSNASGLRAASVNGDSSTYMYPVDGSVLYPNARTIGEMLDKVKSDFVGTEDKELNCFDFGVPEVVDGATSIEVANSGNRDIQPITVFKRASYDDRDTVLARLKAQVHRQLANGELLVKSDE